MFTSKRQETEQDYHHSKHGGDCVRYTTPFKRKIQSYPQHSKARQKQVKPVSPALPVSLKCEGDNLENHVYNEEYRTRRCSAGQAVSQAQVVFSGPLSNRNSQAYNNHQNDFDTFVYF